MTLSMFGIYFYMREKGKVVEVGEDVVKINIEPGDACKKCPAAELCHPAGDLRIVEAKSSLKLDVGDEVVIEVSPKSGLTAMFLLFGIPVIMALIGIFIGNSLNDLYTVIFGLVGFGLGLIFAKIINNAAAKKQKLLPRVVCRLSAETEVEPESS